MLRAHLRRRRLARHLSADLVAEHGPAAHALARTAAIEAANTPDEWLSWRIVHHVERRLGVRWEPSSLRRTHLER